MKPNYKAPFPKLIFLLMAFFMNVTTLYAQDRLTLTVRDIQYKQGSLLVALFASQEDFLKNPSDSKIVAVRNSSEQVIFENLKPGQYGISIFHDRNDNGKLDKNLLGIPIEGIAFGNNAMAVFGPPSFKKSKITLGGGETYHVVTLKYY